MSGHQTACHECDLLVDVPDITEGQEADCPRCGVQLTARPRRALQRGLSCALAAIIFLAIGISFPFLSFANGGIEAVMTLPDAVVTIYHSGDAPLAIILFTTIIGAPAALLASIVALTAPLLMNYPAFWLKGLGRFMFSLADWSMVDVFIIGVIVSLVKIMHMADVTLGLSFWGYIGFTMCLVGALSGLDRYQVWSRIEVLSQ
jgi:paraquat-inducible protein A